MGFLDNIITAISPEAGYKREAWRQALEELRGYDAASHGRLNSGWRVFNESAELTDRYSRDVIRKWLKVFYRRFFSQQFKRSCVPDGPKVGTAALSPRGDWRMPSDASAALWQAELETLE